MKTFEAAFKKKGNGKLWWIKCDATNAAEATTKLRDHAENTSHGKTGYRLYSGPTEIKNKKEGQ